MPHDIYWVSGPWQAKLGIGPRPHGDDWLVDAIVRLRRDGIDAILSLLTKEEEKSLGLLHEANVAETNGMVFISHPIPDLHVPASRRQFSTVLNTIDAHLSSGRNVFIHCRQGIGRTGLVAACLLVKNGWTPQDAIEHLTSVRGLQVPQTEEQRRWIYEYASQPRR